MLKELIKVANILDQKNHKEEADQLDVIINKMAAGDYHFGFGPDEKIDFLSKEDSSLFDDENLEQLTEDDTGDYSDMLPEGSSASAEQRLLNLIHGSEELAERLGLKHVEVDMTAEELEDKLRGALNLEELSEEEMDSVLNLAANLLSNPMTQLGGTPRVKVKESA